MKMIVNNKNTLNNSYICMRGGDVLVLINKGFTRIFKNIKDYEIN